VRFLHIGALTILAGLLFAGCEREESLVKVRLVAEERYLIAGETAHLGLHVRMGPGWHTYWKGRSDSGAPLDVRFEAPPGYETREALWPAPERLVSAGGILDHIYHDEVTVILPVAVPVGVAAGDSATFWCVVQWVACRDVCLAGADTVTATFPLMRAGSHPVYSPEADLFRRARLRLSSPDAEPPQVEARWDGDRLILESRESTGMVFYPASDCAELLDPINDAISGSGRLTLRLRPSGGKLGPVKGILEMRTGSKSSSRFVELNAKSPEADVSG
jgi:thiol:disulfide interchange protein DsbD